MLTAYNRMPFIPVFSCPPEYLEIVKCICNYDYYTLITVIQLCVYIIGCLGLLNHCIESSQCVISHVHRVRIAWRLDIQMREK